MDLIKKGEDRILGLDILPGNRQNPQYAYVIFCNEKKISEGIISRSEIIQLIKKHRISIIAIDNIFELFSDSKQIINFLRTTKVRLIQVTGPLGREVKLSYLAKLHGLFKGGKISPELAAEICARLVAMGVGAEIRVFEDISEILVVRTRSLGEGGQHQSKYARVIASVIQRATREIEDLLKKHGLDYDLFVREGDYGIKSARFIVYASYDRVRKIVGKYQGDLFKIDIRPIEREKITFMPSEKIPTVKRLVICGIDPGETTGLAILDLSGNIIYVGSRKNFGLLSIIETIYSFGKPVIIASDIPKMPQFVSRLCKKTGAMCFKPSHLYSIAEKNDLIRQQNIKVSNSHERDALVAALLAFRKFKSVFQKIENITSYIPLSLDLDEIKKDVIMGSSIKEAISRSVEKALQKIISTPSEYKEPKGKVETKMDVVEENKRLRQKLANSVRRIRELEKNIRLLEKWISEKDSQIKRLKDELIIREEAWRKRMRQELEKLKDNYIRELEYRIKEYRGLINEYQAKLRSLRLQIDNLLMLLRKKPNEIPIKKLRKFDSDSIYKLDKKYGILPGDIIYLLDSSGGGKSTALQLIQKGIRAVISANNRLSFDAENLFREKKIPILIPQDFNPPLSIPEDSDILLIEEKSFEQALNNMRLRELPEDEAIFEEVEMVLSEWRKKRLKELEKAENK